jgi:hypothetical protein
METGIAAIMICFAFCIPLIFRVRRIEGRVDFLLQAMM